MIDLKEKEKKKEEKQTNVKYHVANLFDRNCLALYPLQFENNLIMTKINSPQL